LGGTTELCPAGNGELAAAATGGGEGAVGGGGGHGGGGRGGGGEAAAAARGTAAVAIPKGGTAAVAAVGRAMAPARRQAGPPTAAAPSAGPTAPLLDLWRRVSDGRLNGRVFGKRNISDGAKITTAPLLEVPGGGEPMPGMTVGTATGSRYVLGEYSPRGD